MDPEGEKNSSGLTGRPRKAPSSKWTKCSASSSIRCSEVSLAWEVSIGWSAFNHSGTWPALTRWIRRTHGANRCTLRRV